jgi:hypothetical protein
LKPNIVPATISVAEAVHETVVFLLNLDMAANSEVTLSLRAELKNNFAIIGTAKSRLHIACAERKQVMVALEPGGGSFYELPAEYFNRPSSAAVFERGELDLSGLEAGDPIYDRVGFADGWQCAFFAAAFFEWLRDRRIGAAVEPGLRPFFNMSALEAASLYVTEDSELASEEAAVGIEAQSEVTLPAVCPEPEPEGTAIEGNRQAATIATSKSPINPVPEPELSSSWDPEGSGSEPIRPRDRKKAETAKRYQEILEEASSLGLDNKTAAAQKIARSRKIKAVTVFRIINRELARKNNRQNS